MSHHWSAYIVAILLAIVYYWHLDSYYNKPDAQIEYCLMQLPKDSKCLENIGHSWFVVEISSAQLGTRKYLFHSRPYAIVEIRD